MKKVNQAIEKFEYVVGAVILVAIVVLVFLSAVARAFKHPIVWSVDASQLAFVWVCMLGADFAQRKCAHMGVDLLTRKLSPTLQKILRLFSNLLSIALLVFLCYWGIYLCFKNHMRTYSTLQISFSWATAAVPVGSLLMIFTLVCQTVDLLKNRKTDTAEIREELEA